MGLEIKALWGAEGVLSVKITSILPEQINSIDAVLMAQIHSGVIIGWKNLPTELQKIVIWIGIEFTQPPMTKDVVVKIKIKPQHNELGTSIFPEKATSLTSREESMSTQFREAVLSLIETEIANSQSTTKALRRLVA